MREKWEPSVLNVETSVFERLDYQYYVHIIQYFKDIDPVKYTCAGLRYVCQKSDREMIKLLREILENRDATIKTLEREKYNLESVRSCV